MGGCEPPPYFHNQVGILTEVAHATPTPRYYDPDSLPAMLGSSRSNTPTNGTDIFYPYPWKGGPSHFSDAIDYMITASMGILSIAADRKEKWLYNMYAMGRDAIEEAEKEGPFAYVVPEEQWDASEAYRLINVLRKTGIEVHRARRAFSAEGTEYDAGSFVILGGQAFRPMLSDLMEPQEYPDRRSTDGTPQIPYDLAGWTLPMQMGVQVDPVQEPFRASLEEITTTPLPQAQGEISPQSDYGFLLARQQNASIEAINRLLADGEQVFWLGDSLDTDEGAYPPGTLIIEASEETRERVALLAEELGLDFEGLQNKPESPLHPLTIPRIGLYKSWVANMDEGWTRWLLKNYAFKVDTLHDADIKNTDLSRYHAIILPSQNAASILNGHPEHTIPFEYTGGLGLEGAFSLKRYVEQGGTLVTLDAASDFVIEQFGLPIRNAVRDVPRQQFFIPGSLIRTHVDTQHLIATGMQEEVAVSFQRSRAFETVRLSGKGEGGQEEVLIAPKPAVQVVARYAEENLLMSGWALGEEKYIGGKAALMNAQLGKGNVVLFGFRPQFRGQPGGTYKLLFNALLAAALDEDAVYMEEGEELPAPSEQSN